MLDTTPVEVVNLDNTLTQPLTPVAITNIDDVTGKFRKIDLIQNLTEETEKEYEINSESFIIRWVGNDDAPNPTVIKIYNEDDTEIFDATQSTKGKHAIYYNCGMYILYLGDGTTIVGGCIVNEKSKVKKIVIMAKPEAMYSVYA